MRVLDLFAGIGGFSLAAHWMGWQTVAFCEQNKFCQQVLRKNFGQGITIHDDIRELDGRQYRGAVDIVCGGFPCQPYSFAGKRKGTEDDRHLWPEMRRVYREAEASFVVGENVLGLVNWSGGLVFEQVQADLEADGYEVWAGVVPACGVGAPHRRNRIWFVANSVNNGNLRRPGTDASSCGKERLPERHEVQRLVESVGLRDDPNGCGYKLQGSENIGSVESRGAFANEQSVRLFRPAWEKFPTQPPVCGRDDGIPNRVDRIKALGNSIVPQVAYEIFKAIEQTEICP